jgi:DNA-binding NtrC family response regulator
MVTIYGLIDPRIPEKVRYVGQALQPRIRHLQHCAECATSPKGQWLESLREQGVLPQMVVLGVVAEDEAGTLEKIWIARLQPEFLTNDAVVRAQKLKSIPPEPCANRNAFTLLEDTQRAQIEDMLKQCRGNKQEAAKRLGLGRQTLYNKLKRFGINYKNKPTP